jgi:16S rRNA (uracil1498-N3)-methyltransferase
MQRIYYKELKDRVNPFTLKNEEIIHQLTKVLRSKIWDYVAFFNWVDNFEYIYTIEKINKKEINFSLFDSSKNNNEIDFTLNLFQALPNKLEKIEYILQKWTEVGYSSFFFYKAERSQKLNLSLNKIERFKKIIIEAVEQSGRHKIPEFKLIDKIPFTNLKNDENIFFDTNFINSNILKNLILDHTKNINLFVWPEWWFFNKEILEFEKNKFKKVFLGNRILRTETVWIASGFFIVQNK